MGALYKNGENVLHGRIEDVFYVESTKAYQYKIDNVWYNEKAISPKLRTYEYYQRLMQKSTFTKKEELTLVFIELVLLGHYNHDEKIVNIFFDGVEEGGKIPKDIWMLSNVQFILKTIKNNKNN